MKHYETPERLVPLACFFSLDASSWGQLSHSSSPSVVGDDCGDGFPECGMGIPSTTMPVSHKESYLFNFFLWTFCSNLHGFLYQSVTGILHTTQIVLPFFLVTCQFLEPGKNCRFLNAGCKVNQGDLLRLRSQGNLMSQIERSGGSFELMNSITYFDTGSKWKFQIT